MAEIRLYIEGGSSVKSSTRALLRQGFSAFLKSVIQKARDKNISWKIIIAGNTSETIKGYLNAVKCYPGSQIFLIIDSDRPVVDIEPSLFIAQNHASFIAKNHVNNSHLMVQVMESWFIADSQALIDYYGADFRASSLPSNPNVEQVSKDSVLDALRLATRGTKKGEYRKIQHASDLLAKINPDAVFRKARHCKRLFTTLQTVIASI